MREIFLYAHSPDGLCAELEPHHVMLSDQNTCVSHGGGAYMAAVLVVHAYLSHKETPPSQDPTAGPRLGGPRGGGCFL